MDQTLRQKVQTQIVELLTSGLESGEISEERARNIARMVLEQIPEGITDEELMRILPQLDNDFAELTDVVIPILSEYEEKIRLAVEEKVLQLVRAQKFTEGAALAKQAIADASKISK